MINVEVGGVTKNGWRVRFESKVQNMKGHLSQLVAIHQSKVLSAHLHCVVYIVPNLSYY